MHVHTTLRVGCSTFKCGYVETETPLAYIFHTRADHVAHAKGFYAYVAAIHVHVRAQVRYSKISKIYASTLRSEGRQRVYDIHNNLWI